MQIFAGRHFGRESHEIYPLAILNKVLYSRNSVYRVFPLLKMGVLFENKPQTYLNVFIFTLFTCIYINTPVGI